MVQQSKKLSLTRTIKTQFEKARKWGWDKIYVFVDLHETILIPDWGAKDLTHDYYPEAMELLQELTARKDICLIMHTCSHPHQIGQYNKNFMDHKIYFDYVNRNPEIKTDSRYGYYEHKPYYNILFDDKAGFHPDDIPTIREEFKKHTLI